MKLKHIPRAEISPIMRLIMVNQGQTSMMVKVPAHVKDGDAQGSVDYAADAARLSIMRGYKGFAEAFTAELMAMNMGFEVMEMPFMLS